MLRFRGLGPLEVWTGQDWSGMGAPKWRALLAVLLMSQGQVVSTDRLIAELWGDRPPDRAANLVSIYVLRLRRVLGDQDGHLLTPRAPGYQLRLQPGELDAEQFRGLAGQGRRTLAEGDFRAAADVVAEALGLWRGRALADVPPFALVTAEAERLEESRLTALELRIEAAPGCGMHAQLVPELRRLLSDQPLREGLWGLLMQALDAAGRHAEALAAYGQARKVIAEELGVDPGPELQRLYQALLTADLVPRQQRGAVTRATAAAIGGTPRPPGAPPGPSPPPPACPPSFPPTLPTSPAARRTSRNCAPRCRTRSGGITRRWRSQWWLGLPAWERPHSPSTPHTRCGGVSPAARSTSARAGGGK